MVGAALGLPLVTVGPRVVGNVEGSELGSSLPCLVGASLNAKLGWLLGAVVGTGVVTTGGLLGCRVGWSVTFVLG